MGKQQKPAYIVVSCIGGHLSFYRETGLGMFRIFTSNRTEAKRFPFDRAIKLQDWRTFAIKESLLDNWLADPPKKVREILARQSTEGYRPASNPTGTPQDSPEPGRAKMRRL